MRADIVCLGEPLAELNQQPDGRFLLGYGGDTSNAAIAAARQAASVAYVSRVGCDAFGDGLLQLWRQEGVDAGGVTRDEAAPTGIYFVTHGEEGHAFSYRRTGSAASRLAPSNLPMERIRSARVLHVSGISQAISASAADAVFAAIEAVREAGGMVAYDSNLRLALWPLSRARAIIHEAMAQAHVALPGLDDAVLLTGLDEPDAIVDFYLGLGAEIVALTQGASGALVATAGERRHIAPFKVAPVDATGAGDAFDGAFLAQYLRQGDPFEAARHASAAAALSTRGYGAVAPMPGRQEVEALLADNAPI